MGTTLEVIMTFIVILYRQTLKPSTILTLETFYYPLSQRTEQSLLPNCPIETHYRSGSQSEMRAQLAPAYG